MSETSPEKRCQLGAGRKALGEKDAATLAASSQGESYEEFQ
jgi:hypothetical protein